MSEDHQDGEKKKSRPRKKNTTLPSLSGTTSKIPQYIESAIKEAFIRFNDVAELKKLKLKDLEHLDKITQEYLKTFIILGYDLTGEKVHIFHATCPHDKDALVEHLRTTLISIVSNNSGDDN
jgi:hypothetical protein